MSKYMSNYSLVEIWETFKNSDISDILPLVDAIENLSQNPTEDNINMVRSLEESSKPEIEKLEPEDRHVLEDMVVRILFQSYRKIREGYKRWDLTMDRMADKNVKERSARVKALVYEIEANMNRYASSGQSSKEYINQQQKRLDELKEEWKNVKKDIEPYISIYYMNFFDKQIQNKISVIERHVEHFGDNLFGSWLKSIRQNKGWSLEEAGEATDISVSYIYRMESGTRGAPSVPKLIQLAQGYEIPLAEMLTMSSGELQAVDLYIEDSTYLINGEVATDKQKVEIAELVRLVIDGQTEEAYEQITNVQNVTNA